MFEAPVPVGDENFLVHGTHENANDQLLSPIVGAQQPSTSQGRIRAFDPCLPDFVPSPSSFFIVES